MKRFAALTTCAASLLCSRCAPDNASEVRELKPESVGLWGVIHHSEGDKAFGITGDYYGASKVANNGLVPINDPERDPKILYQWDVSAFYHHYPWKTSAFFVGAGAAYVGNEIQWSEQTTAYTSANKTLTDVKYGDKALYLRMPVGWAWIWNSGFTLMLDFGPGVRVVHDHKWTNDGSTGGVDVGRRDDFANKITDPLIKFGASGLIGWSF